MSFFQNQLSHVVITFARSAPFLILRIFPSLYLHVSYLYLHVRDLYLLIYLPDPVNLNLKM